MLGFCPNVGMNKSAGIVSPLDNTTSIPCPLGAGFTAVTLVLIRTSTPSSSSKFLPMREMRGWSIGRMLPEVTRMTFLLGYESLISPASSTPVGPAPTKKMMFDSAILSPQDFSAERVSSVVPWGLNGATTASWSSREEDLGAWKGFQLRVPVAMIR